MTIADIRKNAETKMAKTVEAFKHELQKVRTGRAHPGILDQVLDRLATFLEKELEMRQKVRSAMMYPIVIFFFATVVMGVRIRGPP